MVMSTGGVGVVELPQTPEEEDPEKRWSCKWKAGGSITVGAFSHGNGGLGGGRDGGGGRYAFWTKPKGLVVC